MANTTTVTDPMLLDATGQDIVDELQNIVTAIGQSGGGGGHTIVNSAGTEMTQRSKMKFMNSSVTDDPTNGMTVVSPANIHTTTTDPGEGSALATNTLLIVIEE